MAIQTGGMEYLRSIALLLAAHDGLITLTTDDEDYISKALNHELAP